MASADFEIQEFDLAGQIVALYTKPRTASTQTITIRTLPAVQNYAKSLTSAFLPAGYPHSVTADYLPYQIYDSLQAFSSSIAGLLASRAVLEGIGVGDVSGSPTAAVLLSILQESVGRIATIVFGARLGTSLEPECKMYRLLADIFNDAAMVLDCLSPALPKVPRVFVLSFASGLRALCGVAAGSSKASLSAHFATQGNLGELNAKDSSQETIISLFGMMAGSLVVTYIATPLLTWASLICLLSLHLFTNYLAVRSVSMKTLNRQRANIVFERLLQTIDKDEQEALVTNKIDVYTPENTARLEKIFERDGVIRQCGCIIGHCEIGVSMKDILNTLGQVSIQNVLSIYEHEDYVVWFDKPREKVMIVLKVGAGTRCQLRAWLQAFLLCTGRHHSPTSSVLDELAKSLEVSRKLWAVLEPVLESNGWDLDNGALQTKSGVRIKHTAENKKRI